MLTSCNNEYANDKTTTNTIGGFWSLLKFDVLEIYHFWLKKHLQKYVDELIRIFTHEKELNKLVENSNQENLLEMYQVVFKLWNETLTANIIYQKQTLILNFS